MYFIFYLIGGFMGRKAIHTQEEVFKVADELAAQGKEVAANALYEALGSRGSMTTIYKNLDLWEAKRKEQAVPVPVAIPDSVLASFTQTWQVAAQEAAKQVAAIREKADAEVRDMAKHLDDAKISIERLEVEGEIEAGRLDALDRELSDTKRAAGAAATEAAKREAALAATVEQMHNQLAEQQTALQRGHEEHQAFRQDKADEVARLTADFMNRLAEQAEALRFANADVSSLRGKLDDSTGQLAAAREESGAAKADAARSLTIAQQVDQMLVDTRRQLEEVNIEAKATAARSLAAAQQAEQVLADTRRQLDETSAKALDLTGQLGNLAGQCDTLRAQVQSQENIIRGFAVVPAQEKTDTNPPADTGKAKK